MSSTLLIFNLNKDLKPQGHQPTALFHFFFLSFKYSNWKKFMSILDSNKKDIYFLIFKWIFLHLLLRCVTTNTKNAINLSMTSVRTD